MHAGCNITYEMEYMTYVMAPLLGREYVFPGVGMATDFSSRGSHDGF
jgi:hypothetical protein